jgi:hypothetical protein
MATVDENSTFRSQLPVIFVANDRRSIEVRVGPKELSDLLRGRVVSELAANAEHLELRFNDGSALTIELTSRGYIGGPA